MMMMMMMMMMNGKEIKIANDDDNNNIRASSSKYSFHAQIHGDMRNKAAKKQQAPMHCLQMF